MGEHTQQKRGIASADCAPYSGRTNALNLRDFPDAPPRSPQARASEKPVFSPGRESSSHLHNGFIHLSGADGVETPPKGREGEHLCGLGCPQPVLPLSTSFEFFGRLKPGRLSKTHMISQRRPGGTQASFGADAMKPVDFHQSLLFFSQTPTLRGRPTQIIPAMVAPHTMPALKQALKLSHLPRGSCHHKMGASRKEPKGPDGEFPTPGEAIGTLQEIQALGIFFKKDPPRKSSQGNRIKLHSILQEIAMAQCKHNASQKRGPIAPSPQSGAVENRQGDDY
jgi:hypothetical protein